MTKPSFRISTKIQLHNLYKTSAAKWWTNSSFKILPELQLQNLDQPCAQSLNKSLALGPNVSSQICNKLLPTWSSLSTSAKVTTSTSFELAPSHARATSIKFTKQQLVSESVSQLFSDEHSQWSDSGPIKSVDFWCLTGAPNDPLEEAMIFDVSLASNELKLLKSRAPNWESEFFS